MQSLIQSNSRLILHLINGISNDPQKLLIYFNGKTFFVFFSRAVFVINSICCFSASFELSAVKAALLAGTSSLLNCHKLPYMSE